MMIEKPMRNSQPSLKYAEARVRRAKYHLTRLKKEATTFWRDFNAPTGYMDPRSGGTLIIDYSRTLLPTILSILVGETIYNLRAALDYLVFELAILDSGQIQEGTQFPIESSDKGWEDRSGSLLLGLSDGHKDMIRALQPCFGCEWTATLRDISNPDKHRTLTVVHGKQTITVEPTSKGPVFLDPSKEGPIVLFSLEINPKKDDLVNEKRDVSFELAFSDRKLVTGTMETLQDEVSSVLASFDADFG